LASLQGIDLQLLPLSHSPEVDDYDSTVVLSVWQYLGSGYLNPAARSWQPASTHPYGPPAKRCSICVASHRKQEPSPDGLGLWSSTPKAQLARSQLCRVTRVSD
jgi:hypothetical protein